jgi:DNA-directed RNA polymerase specialized sigma24 family protein
MKAWSRLVLGIAVLSASSAGLMPPQAFLFSLVLCFFLSALSHDDDMPPEELFRRCARVPPDEKMWRELLRRYADGINKAIGKVIGFAGWQHQRLFVEAQQEFHLRLLANEGRALLAFRGHTEPEARVYLQRIAHSAALTVAMRDKRHRPPQLPPPEEPQENVVAPDGSGDLREALKKCLQKMLRGRNKARNILMFKIFALEDLKPAEIAQIRGLHMTLRSIEIQISRIREKMRKCFGKK